MTTLKIITFLLLLVSYSCIQKSAKHTINTDAIKLHNKIIPLINYRSNADSSKRALLYLDSATAIDSNCFSCYYEKLMFLSALNNFDQAIVTINNCIRIKPNAYDHYLTAGVLYAKTGDSSSAKKYFEKSLSILNPVLDTMQTNNDEYKMLIANKALSLIMINDTRQLNKLLDHLNIDFDTTVRKNILRMKEANKNELIDKLVTTPSSN